MPPVILEARKLVGYGRYLWEIRISKFSPSPEFPKGIRYSLCLVDPIGQEVVLLYDVHRGKPYHRHLRGNETSYAFTDVGRLLDDFFREVDLISEGKL